MLERLQSALKTVKDAKPPSLMSHRFVTVRRGSPAARSGQVQPGDQLEAVEGRPVAGLQHRDLAQILRRAGNTLRLSLTPRQQSSSLSEGAELDVDSRGIKGSRRSKDETRFYNVDLERGPTGFGFSLRGGSEYNMGLYVLGLMDGGPAQRSNKIQVSDQLVEINGDSTTGMTHSQAVEQIRRGGQRIHLVLKKGNGYVPDYGPEERALSPSSSVYTEGREAVTMATTSFSRHSRGGGGGEGGGERRKRRERTGGGGSGPDDLDLDLVEEEAREEELAARRRQEEERRRRKEEEERRRKKEEEEERRRRKVEEEERRRKEEEEERRERKSQTVRQKKRDDQKEQGRRSRSLPRNGASRWGFQQLQEAGGVPGASGRSQRRSSGRQEEGQEEGQEEREGHDNSTHNAKHPARSAQRAAFSFLMPMDDAQRLSDSESAASYSEVSLSAASIATAGREEPSGQQGGAPGPWLKPSPKKLTQVLIGSQLRGGLAL